MSKYKKLDFKNVKTQSIDQRENKITIEAFASPITENPLFSQFLSALPDVLAARDFKQFLDYYCWAIEKKSMIILMMGAHVIKVGLNPILIDAMKNNWVTHLAMNGAGAIHDVEIALNGGTSEDVARGLEDGTFGMARETAEIINESVSHAEGNSGYGEAIAIALDDSKFKYKELSLLYQAYKLDIPITIHTAIGTEIIHQHPNVNGAAIGTLSLNDFKIFANSISMLNPYSIVMNIGSAVMLPEVFLKGLTIVRNLGYKAFNFTTAVFDMFRHYRPTVNVMERPVKPEGRGFYFIGHHELMIPLLFASLKSYIDRQSHP
jgi:hypothetical protein